MKLYENLLATVGNTPLVKLNKLTSKKDAEVYVKLEFFNPGGSIKDRIAFGMIEDLEKRGMLKKGMTIIESSSGNTAIGLAIAGAVKGYKVIAICDRYLPFTKRWKLQALGASILFLPQTKKGEDTVELRKNIAIKLANTLPGCVTLNQYDNIANRETHFRTTGQEIIRDTEGKVDMVVCAVGTTGTISGVGKAIKEKLLRVQVVGVEPIGSIIFGGKSGPYLTQGGGLSFIPGNLDRSVIDIGVKVSDKDAFETCRKLAKTEGIMVGGSSGAVVFAAMSLAKKLGGGKRIVAVLPDGGERYLDTVYSDQWLSENDIKIPPLARKTDKALQDAAKKVNCTVNGF